MELASSFIERLKKYMPTNNDVVYIDIISCEFTKYYFVNFKRRPIISTLRFIFDLILVKKYNYNVTKQDEKSPVLTINTAEYLYRDNIKPLVLRINSKGIGSMELSRDFKGRSVNPFFIADIYRIIRLIIRNNIKIKIKDLIPFFYYNLISVRYVNHIIKSLDVLNLNQLKIAISADPCDLFSRVVFSYFKNMNVKTIILQSGPTDHDSCEWKMQRSDLLCCWLESEDFFEKEKVNYKVFFPPRFYYALENKSNLKIFDLFIFLTWVENSNLGRKIENSMIKTMNCISKEFKGRVGLKFHPAYKISIPKLSNKIEIIDTDVNAIEIIGKSHKVLNFGSTLIYDCTYQKVPVGIINFEGQIPDYSTLLKQGDNVKVLKNTADLITFINNSNDVIVSNNLNDSVYKGSLIEKYIYDELLN
jgi:hypothetical protein